MEGSRILITTRNLDVSNLILSTVNRLHRLSEEHSWELFLNKMLEKDLSANLLNIAKGIVENCIGLPLSIVIIAGMLSATERTEQKWNQVAKSVSSLVLSNPQGKCKDILELSYNHLSNHLRPCFLYLGSFPEDTEISVNRLIMRWIGEGLVLDRKSDSAEDVAKKYMEELIVKSLVIPVKFRARGEVETFRLHDLMRDYCLDKGKEKHFLTLAGRGNDFQTFQDPRRLIINAPRTKGLNFSCHSIRSMICFENMERYMDRIVNFDIELLRVFEVWSSNFPNISSLVHLRYLACGSWSRSWNFRVLPSAISKLQNLQILILRASSIAVPDVIWDMVKLRHVHITPRGTFEGSNRLANSSFLSENLRSLSKAFIRDDGMWLKKLCRLQRLSCIFSYLYPDTEEEGDDTEKEVDLEANQFQMISFNSHLISLKVHNQGSPKLRFISKFLLPIGLQELTLSGFCLTSNDISEIGKALPQLEVFKIYSCFVPSEFKWNVDDTDFPNLKVLKLRDLGMSEWTASENSFPNLEKLWVEKCYYLDEIPLDFGSLLNLRLITVRDCAPSFDDSVRDIEKLQHEEQNTEMRVHIHHSSHRISPALQARYQKLRDMMRKKLLLSVRKATAK